MRKLINAAIVGTALVALTLVPCGTASAANVVTAAAGVNLIPNLGLTNLGGMIWGQFVPSASAGTINWNGVGIRMANGGVTLGNGGNGQTAGFAVTGAPNSTYAITLDVSAVISSGGNNMTVDSFNFYPVTAGTMSAGGTDGFGVGAVLHVGANQAVGAYTGSFNATVAYN